LALRACGPRTKPRHLQSIPALFASLVSCCIASSASAEPACTLDRAVGTTIDAAPFRTNMYGTRWNLATNRLAVMTPDARGYYKVFAMRPDGGGLAPMGGSAPNKHQGSVYWHPSGRYLMFTAEKPEWHSAKLFGIPDFEALPGFGLHDDIWLISADGSRTWQLTDEANAREQGVLMPVFSPDGRHVAWASRQVPTRTYAIVVADFVETPEPHLEKLRSFKPGGSVYYETGSFSSDSRSLTYTSDQDTKSFWASQIYRLDLADGSSHRLTTDHAYNEHPTVVNTPAGDWVVYMSDKGVDRFSGHIMPGTDWWAMRLDGSGVKRLTTMNVNRPGNPENAGFMQVATTVAIGPAGDMMLGDVQDSLVKQTGLIRVVHLLCR
jgi:Tol biopolymer transport system component